MTTAWFDDYVHANGIRIHYTRTGGPKPPLLLLHGMTDNGLCWTRVARALEHDYDIIMPDARGHGLSDGPETGFSIQILAEDAAALIQALALPRPYVLGHSMGASTTGVLAARHPESARAILLEDPAWLSATPKPLTARGDQKVGRTRSLQWIFPLLVQSRAERIATQRAISHWVDEELEPWSDSKDQFNLEVIEYNDADTRRRTVYWRDYLPKISAPILLITAEPRRGALITPRVAQEASQLWQDGELVHIPGAGHNIRRDQFEPYMAAVNSFLQRH